MNPSEKAYNKGLMKEIKEKQRIMKKKQDQEAQIDNSSIKKLKVFFDYNLRIHFWIVE